MRQEWAGRSGRGGAADVEAVEPDGRRYRDVRQARWAALAGLLVGLAAEPASAADRLPSSARAHDTTSSHLHSSGQRKRGRSLTTKSLDGPQRKRCAVDDDNVIVLTDSESEAETSTAQATRPRGARRMVAPGAGSASDPIRVCDIPSSQ